MFLLLLGCGLPLDKADDAADTGGDTGPSANDPWACVETGRAPIDDPTVAAEGMSFAPADVAAAFAGGFAGRFAFVAGDEQFAGFGVNPEGAWELVSREGQGTDLGEGAPVEACDPYYAFATDAILNDASGALDERFAATLLASSVDAVTLSAAVPLEAVVGTTRPSWDPEDWATNTLSISGTGVPGTWTVSVLWSGAASADAKEESGTDSGTVEPAGTVETVGTGTFAPAED